MGRENVLLFLIENVVEAVFYALYDFVNGNRCVRQHLHGYRLGASLCGKIPLALFVSFGGAIYRFVSLACFLVEQSAFVEYRAFSHLYASIFHNVGSIKLLSDFLITYCKINAGISNMQIFDV